MYKIAIKSGTNGHADYDNNDLILAEIPSNNIPRVGDIIEMGDKKTNHNNKKYLVREVKYFINHKTDKHEFQEFIYVYVISI